MPTPESPPPSLTLSSLLCRVCHRGGAPFERFLALQRAESRQRHGHIGPCKFVCSASAIGVMACTSTDFHLVDAEDHTTWRYTVKLDGGEAFKLKRTSVRAEGPVGAGKAKVKVKGNGKGKKERK